MFSHGDLRLEAFTDPMFGENGYIVWREGRTDCWIVDPGLPPQPMEIAAAIERRGLSPVAFVVTHGHADHIAGLTPLRAIFPKVPIFCPRGEAALLTSAEANLSAAMGFPITAPAPERLLDPGESLTLSELAWTTLDVAGHSPAGMAFYCAQPGGGDGGVLISGDAVFADSIGRYDFPHSNHKRLIRNIRDHVLTLNDRVVVYSGHGPPAMVGDIRRHNQVLRSELAELQE